LTFGKKSRTVNVALRGYRQREAGGKMYTTCAEHLVVTARLSPKLFLDAWNSSDSVTEVAVKLYRAGVEYDPDRVVVTAWVFAELGHVLKPIRRSELPDFIERPPAEPVLVRFDPPESATEREVAFLYGAAEGVVRGANGSFEGHFVNDVWAFRKGSMG
jgi:hypothetical protein